MNKIFTYLVLLMLTCQFSANAQQPKPKITKREIPQKVEVFFSDGSKKIITPGTNSLGKPASKNLSIVKPSGKIIAKAAPQQRIINTNTKTKSRVKISARTVNPRDWIKIPYFSNKLKGQQRLFLYKKQPSQSQRVITPSAKSVQACADTIILTSQAQIDNFSNNYAACTTPNYLFIDGTSASPAITNLNGLSAITQVINKLTISNTSITDLSALNNLTYVGDTLQLDSNAVLTSTGLNNISHLGALILIDLPALTSIAGISNKTDTIGGLLQIISTGLTNLTGLSGIRSVMGDLNIDNSQITSFSDLPNLSTIKGHLNLNNDLSLTSIGLHNLTTCDGFLFNGLPNITNLEDISHHLINKNIGQFWMINMNGLANLSGLDSIRSLVSIYLWGNHNMTSLHGIEQISGDVYFGFSISDAPLLTDISALSNITELGGGTLDVNNCPLLPNLTGVRNISNIGNGLKITNNPLLTTLSDLDSTLTINPAGDDSLEIHDNPKLALCSFAPICNYLGANNGGRADIYNNATGCGSLDEVLASCGGLSLITWNGNDSQDWNDAMNWTPNGLPSISTKVFIPSSNDVPNYPMVANNIYIGGLIMENGAELDMNTYDLNITDSLRLDNSSIYNGNNIIASSVLDPYITSNNINGNFSLLGYYGECNILFNTINGNTILSDSSIRAASSQTFLNSFNGGLTFISNSDYGNNYLSNASPGNDFISGSLQVINNSNSNISVGLGGGRPLLVKGDFIVIASNGTVDINNLTMASQQSYNHIAQFGSNPIIINNLFMQSQSATILDQTVQINDSLVFDKGSNDLKTSGSNLLVLNNGSGIRRDSANTGGFVNGPLEKIGNTTFTFPIGKYDSSVAHYLYAPLTITAPVNSTDEYIAEYFHHNPSLDGYDTAKYTSGFGGVQGKEYWMLTRNNGNSKVEVTLSYDSTRSGVSYLYNGMQVATWDPNLWKSLSSGGFTGTIANGMLLSAGSTLGGPITFSFKPVRKPVITMSYIDTIHCNTAGNFYVPFTLDTLAVANNVFQVNLSDSLGYFGRAVLLGSKATIHSDSISTYYPGGVVSGKPYKIRIVGNLPPDTSVNTRTVIFLTQPVQAFNIIGETPTCLASGVKKYYPNLHEPGVTYTWTLSGGGSLTNNGDTALVTWTTAGIYSLTCKSSTQCGNGPQSVFSVEVKPPAPTQTPTINGTGRWLYASQAPSLAGYQWYKNATIIAGATNASYYALLGGDYTDRFTSYCGSGPLSDTISFATNSITQTINFPAIPNKTIGDASFVLVATASSGLPVSLSIVSGPAIINTQTNLLTIIGTGLVTVRANQVGNNVYDTAAPVTQSFTVNKSTQNITFPVIANQDIKSNATVKLGGFSSSNLLISYSIVSGPATVSDSTLILTGIGTVIVRASQSGNNNYLPASNVDLSFCSSVSALNPISGYTNLCPGTAIYTVNNVPGATYLWQIVGGSTLASATNSANVTWVTPGTYQLLVSASGNCGAASINDTLIVNVINGIQPDSVHGMLPANGVISQQLPLKLSWIPANPNAFYTFDLYVWQASQPQPGSPYVTGLTTVNYTIPVSSGLLSNTAYKWMVVAHNGSCTRINTGPIQQFTLIPLPDLQVVNVQAPATAFSGQTITINWTVKNNGPGITTTNQNWTDAVFLSFDTIPEFGSPTLNPGAWSALQFPIKPLLIGTRPNVTALNNGQQYSNSINFTLPLNYSQRLYAYVITNYPAGVNAPQQVIYANDTASAPQSINVTLSPTPDLRVDTVFTPTTTFSGSTINLTYKVKNYGVLTPFGSNWSDKVYISQSPIFDINTAVLLKAPKSNGTYYANAPDAVFGNYTQLLADSFYTSNVPVVIPNYIFGTYFIYVFTNQTGALYEGALNNNNTNSAQVQVFLTPTPHLIVNSLTIPLTTASITQPIGVNWNIANTGFNDNIEKNKGHYFVYNGICRIPTYCEDPVTHDIYVCGSFPGIDFKDSVNFGSSYWLDRIYLSKDSTGLNINTSILVNQTAQGVLNSGLNVPDDYTNPAAVGCKLKFTSGNGFNLNTQNVIKPGSNHPMSGNFIIPDNLATGNYYVYVLTNSNNTVYEYPGLPETRRSTLPISIQRPDALVSSISVPGNVMGGQSFLINYSILNNGPGGVFNHIRRDNIYVSLSAVFDASAQLISTQTYSEDLPVGTVVPHSLSYTFPASTSGNRYFYVYTNFDSSFRETNQNNNISNAAGTMVSTAIANDLVVSSIQLADTVYNLSQTYFKYTVANSGSGTTSGNWTDSIFISCSPTFDPASAFYIGRRIHNEIMTGGGSYSDSFNISIPLNFKLNNCFPKVAYTTAYFYIKTNADNGVYEGVNGNNNVLGTGSRVDINPLVDQIVTQVTGPDTATVGRPYLTGWTVQNIGKNPGYYFYSGWYDAVYFSPDSVFNGNAVLATYFYENNTLNTNQIYTDSKIVTAPNLPTGDYYVLVNTNFTNTIAAEVVLSNNTNVIRDGFGVAKKIHLIQPLLPDLTDSILSAPPMVAVGQPITIVHQATNNGSGVTYPVNWSDDMWLSSDFIPGNSGDILLSAKNHVGNLQPGQSYKDTTTATIGLNVSPSNYVLISRVNATGNVFESNGNNNLAFKYITIYRPAPSDLIVQNIMTPDTVFLGYTIDTAKWIIRNNSANAATGVSSDGIYLSQSNILDSTAVLIGIKNKNINMGPLTSDTISLNPLVNNITEGNYNVIVKTDLLNNIYESDKTNNTSVSSKPINVSVKELPFNILTANTLFNIDRFYKLIIPDSLNGATILVTLKSIDSLSINNQMFIGKGYVPSSAHFDYSYNTPNYGNQDIIMSSATAGTYYIVIHCSSVNPVNQNITLKAVKLPFSILSVQSSSGGNIGNVTVKLIGSLFTNNMKATLTKPGTTIIASSVYFSNSTLVYATFNLQGKPLGIYDVTLTKSDSTFAALPGSFSVVPANNGGLNNGGGTNKGPGDGNAPGCDPGATGGINSQLVTEIVAPAKVFGGWPFVIQINYNNPTNVDIPAQVRVLYSERNILMALTAAGVATGTTALTMELTENGGPPGIIRAGGSGTILVYGKAPVSIPGHTHVIFRLK